jgi:hypothetical protein
MLDIQVIRRLVQDALRKHMFGSAVLMAEKLIRMPSVTTADMVLFADCYFQSGEYRRCVAVLEQSGLLSAQTLSEVGEYLHPSNDDDNKLATANIESFSLFEKINAIQLGARCLMVLEEYDDCINLLDSLLLTSSFDEVDVQSQYGYLPNYVLYPDESAELFCSGALSHSLLCISQRAKLLYENRPTEEINAIAGTLCGFDNTCIFINYVI